MLTAGPLKPYVKEMRPAATLKGVPVAVNAPMAGMWAAARLPYSICWMPTHTPVFFPKVPSPSPAWPHIIPRLVASLSPLHPSEVIERNLLIGQLLCKNSHNFRL